MNFLDLLKKGFLWLITVLSKIFINILIYFSAQFPTINLELLVSLLRNRKEAFENCFT